MVQARLNGNRAPGSHPALPLTTAVLSVLDAAGLTIPRLLHGAGRSAWALVEEAGRRGLDTRIGLEDTLSLPDGGRPGLGQRGARARGSRAAASRWPVSLRP